MAVAVGVVLLAPHARWQRVTLLSGADWGRTKSSRCSAVAAWARSIAPIDTRVGRTVAIKVLPPKRRRQSDRRQRFEREARAVAR